MDEPFPPTPDRRAEAYDGDILAPRGEIEILSGIQPVTPRAGASPAEGRFDLPLSAIEPLFRYRLDRVFRCQIEFDVDINNRPTTRVLGGYYKSRRLIRVYARDRELGRRPLEELFDTFLHETAHHLEYTEPYSFSAGECGRVPGRMHSRLFWRILGELKYRWAHLQRYRRDEAQHPF